ncbi:UDP-N-acetylmuramate dehydrogenase [Clostridiales Family XIII bacterium PM5-7]
MERLTDVEMKTYTSFKTGGKAKEMIIPNSREELLEALREINQTGSSSIIIGNGSNTLVTDAGYQGTIIKLGEAFCGVEVKGDRLTAGSGTLMSIVAKAAMTAELAGFEFASGIPGSIGGATFMNAGAYDGEMKDIIESVTIAKKDGSKIETLTVHELDLSYRHSKLEETGDVVIDVTLKLEKGDRQEIATKMAEFTKRRNEKQPVQYPSCGSFFKRPTGYFAGKLIQDAGLKGLTVGGAQVSELHSGFIINRGGATAADIIALMHLVQNTVYDQSGVMLEPEVRIIGD